MSAMEDFWGPAISTYTWQQAVEDGVLVKLFEERWGKLSNGRPILATRSLVDAFSLAAFVEMWNDFVRLASGQRAQGSRLEGNLSADRMVTSMNGEPIWLVNDGAVYTFTRPDEV
jgi:hypothetical protein